MDRNQSKHWTENDLQGLIDNQIQEDYQLDYKACGALQNKDKNKKEIAKDVSSFANAGGGIIIYGICEDEKNHIPQKLDKGFDPNEISKEWLEQVIQGNIDPRIPEIHINPVELTQSFPGKFAYVVTIPQGDTAHFSSDGRCYRRYNFNAVHMVGYEIRDVLNRKKFPKIVPDFEIPKSPHPDSNKRRLNIFLENEGTVSAKKIKFTLYWPQIFLVDAFSGFTGTGWHRKDATEPNSLLEISSYLADRVLFPEEKIALDDFVGPSALAFTFRANPKNSPDFKRYRTKFLNQEIVFGWKIFADDMPPTKQIIPLETFFQLDNFFYGSEG